MDGQALAENMQSSVAAKYESPQETHLTGSVCLLDGKRAFWFEAMKGRLWGKGRWDAVMGRAGQWGP